MSIDPKEAARDLDFAIHHWLTAFNDKRRQHIGVTFEDGNHIIDWLEGYGPRLEELVARALLAGEGPVPYGDPGFYPDQYAAVATLFREHLNDDQFYAIASNNHNIILAALDRAASPFMERIETEANANGNVTSRDVARALKSSPSPAVRDAPGWAEAIEAAANTVEEHYWDSPDAAGRALALARKVRTLHPSVAEPDAPKEEQ